MRVVAMNPIAQSLALHATSLRRPFSIHPFKNKRQRQHTPRRRTIAASGRSGPKLTG